MPSERTPKRPRADGSDSGSANYSRNTSEYTFYSTGHSRQRAEQREITRQQLQRCLKHGKPTLEPNHRCKIVYEGVTLITDESRKIGARHTHVVQESRRVTRPRLLSPRTRQFYTRHCRV